MAIGTPTSIGTASDLSSIGSDPLVITTTSTAVVGDEIIVMITGRGSRSWASISDSAGNTYTSMGSDSSGSTNTDTKAQTYRAKVTAQLTSGGTITISNSGISAGGTLAEAVMVSGVTNATDSTGSGKAEDVDDLEPTASITLVASSAIVFASVVQETGSAPLFDEAEEWTSLTGVDAAGATGLAMHTGYRTFDSSGSKTYAPTSGILVEWTCFLGALEEASASGLDFLPLLGVS